MKKEAVAASIGETVGNIGPRRAKAESSAGVADVVAEIEQAAKSGGVDRPVRKTIDAVAPKASLPTYMDRSHTDRILEAGARQQRDREAPARLHREAQSGNYAGKGPDAVNGVKLSQQVLGDFMVSAKAMGFDVTRLGKLNPYELIKARVAHRRFRESAGDRQHIVDFLKELNGEANA